MVCWAVLAVTGHRSTLRKRWDLDSTIDSQGYILWITRPVERVWYGKFFTFQIRFLFALKTEPTKEPNDLILTYMCVHVQYHLSPISTYKLPQKTNLLNWYVNQIRLTPNTFVIRIRYQLVLWRTVMMMSFTNIMREHLNRLYLLCSSRGFAPFLYTVFFDFLYDSL